MTPLTISLANGLRLDDWRGDFFAGGLCLVLGLMVCVDLMTAVAVGVFVANLLTLKNLTNLQIEEVQAITRVQVENWLSLEARVLNRG